MNLGPPDDLGAPDLFLGAPELGLSGSTADVPKWLRGSPAKRVCSACAGSNPAVCGFWPSERGRAHARDKQILLRGFEPRSQDSES